MPFPLVSRFPYTTTNNWVTKWPDKSSHGKYQRHCFCASSAEMWPQDLGEQESRFSRRSPVKVGRPVSERGFVYEKWDLIRYAIFSSHGCSSISRRYILWLMSIAAGVSSSGGGSNEIVVAVVDSNVNTEYFFNLEKNFRKKYSFQNWIKLYISFFFLMKSRNIAASIYAVTIKTGYTCLDPL